jgi:hypothetical protein
MVRAVKQKANIGQENQEPVWCFARILLGGLISYLIVQTCEIPFISRIAYAYNFLLLIQGAVNTYKTRLLEDKLQNYYCHPTIRAIGLSLFLRSESVNNQVIWYKNVNVSFSESNYFRFGLIISLPFPVTGAHISCSFISWNLFSRVR